MTNKVLFIAHYRDNTGWSKAAQEWILALDSVGVDVVPRPVKLNNNIPELPLKIRELENKSSKGCNICIQNVLPHLMDYNGKFDKNIGVFFADTDCIKHSGWPQRLNLMDELWVPNNDMILNCKYSNVNVPVNVVPCTTDIRKFNMKYDALDMPELEDAFVFYHIGDAIRRKNLTALIKAFHLEFSINEPVALLLKTTKYGMSADETYKNLQVMCDRIKEGLKIYPHIQDYKKEYIITEHVKDHIMMKIHATGDCYVAPSFGEAWNIPAFTAMGFGNTPICAKIGGPKDYLKGSSNFVKGAWEPVFGMTETFADICTGRENWFNVCVLDLQRQMRKAYERKSDILATMQMQDFDRLKDYSYETVGNKMKELIDE